MAARLGGTEPGAKHDFAIPFTGVAELLAIYAARDAGKTALVDLDQEISIDFGQLDDFVARVAAGYAAMGLAKGDRIAILSDERLEKILLWLGAWRIGAVVMPLNVEMNISYIAEILHNIPPRLTLWHEDMDGARMTEGVGGEILTFSAWRADDGGDAGSADFMRRIPAFDAAAAPLVAIEADDMASIYCTSGTTDKPKLFACTQIGHWSFGLSSLDFLGLTADDRTLEYRSFGWNSAQGLSLLPWLQTGCTLHFARRFSQSRYFTWIRENRITFAAGIPTVINMLLDQPQDVTAADMPDLRFISSSTAPLSPERWQAFEDRYGIRILQAYGSSEGGWVCANRHYACKKGTVGPPAKHQEFQIVDEQGKPCPPGIEGEVFLGGPQCAVASITTDGIWEDLRGRRFSLGDLAVMDEDGFVTVTGRTKDLIIRGGVNISPMEIDNVLLTHPAVHEAAAIGIPDRIYGEEVIAYVVPRQGTTPSVEELKLHCAKTLPDYRMPKQIHFIDALPKNDRGKLRRADLKTLWERDHAAA
jgi:long-chain acyl-CoA synthetase